MNDKEQSLPAQGGARRRLLRGAFGVPAVLTVASGSVAAASNLNCITNISPFPAVHQGTAPPTTDSIIRIRVYKASDDKRYVRGQDVPEIYMAVAAAGFMKAAQVWRFNVNQNQTVGTPIDPPSKMTLTAINRWAALRFDANGNLVGVGVGGDVGPAGNAVTTSCWNSFG